MDSIRIFNNTLIRLDKWYVDINHIYIAMNESVGNSSIVYNPGRRANINVEVAIAYCRKIIMDNNLQINLTISEQNKDLTLAFPINDNKTLHLFFQKEHNLVLAGGRSIFDGIYRIGKVKSMYTDDNYLVRIMNLQNYHKFDYIVEYSMPNIHNIISSGEFDTAFINKLIYVPPLIYDYGLDGANEKRLINILTSFRYTHIPRRAQLIRNFNKYGINHRNINYIFDADELKGVLDETKIMVNIHQTEHHHTLEEFRVLPALLRGVVVISENVPLKETIPYHQYIVWCDYKDIITIAKKVSNNYSEYYNRIHGSDSGLKEVFKTMEHKAYSRLCDVLCQHQQ